MNVLMKRGHAVGSNIHPTAVPIGVEYEQLSKDLLRETKEKYHDREDLRAVKQRSLEELEDKKIEDKKTVILSPGMLVNYENPQSDTRPYPQSNVPSTMGPGVLWSDA